MKNKIPKVSKKQSRKNREVAKLKASMSPICVVCKREPAVDPAHLLPRSLFPEFYTEGWNIVGMCRCCHSKYDDNKMFRQKQTSLYEIVKANAGEQNAFRYFGIG